MGKVALDYSGMSGRVTFFSSLEQAEPEAHLSFASNDLHLRTAGSDLRPGAAPLAGGEICQSEAQRKWHHACFLFWSGTKMFVQHQTVFCFFSSLVFAAGTKMFSSPSFWSILQWRHFLFVCRLGTQSNHTFRKATKEATEMEPANRNGPNRNGPDSFCTRIAGPERAAPEAALIAPAAPKDGARLGDAMR